MRPRGLLERGLVGGTLLLTMLLSGASPAAPRQEQAGEEVAASVLTGTVELRARGGKRPARAETVAETVVWFEPLWTEPEVRPGTAVLETVDKRFVPRVLAVPRGSAVRFPNRDPILHNAFSVSRGNTFDLGLVEQGPGDEVTFERSGVVRVFCNVHHDMVAYVLVLDTPWFARPDDRGRFVLRGLPPGPGTLRAWHERAEPVEIPVTVPVEAPSGESSPEGSSATPSRGVVVGLEITKPRVPPHLNKFGRRYGRSRDRYP